MCSWRSRSIVSSAPRYFFTGTYLEDITTTTTIRNDIVNVSDHDFYHKYACVISRYRTESATWAYTSIYYRVRRGGRHAHMYIYIRIQYMQFSHLVHFKVNVFSGRVLNTNIAPFPSAYIHTHGRTDGRTSTGFVYKRTPHNTPSFRSYAATTTEIHYYYYYEMAKCSYGVANTP